MNIEEYRNRIYRSYVSLRTGQQAGDLRPYRIGLRDLTWRIGKYLPRNRDAHCLDIACGPGIVLHFLRESGFKNVTGVDLSHEQVALARQVSDAVYECDAMAFLDSERQYDLITAFSFIEHLKREEAMILLDRIYSALRPGGRLIILTPNAESPFASHMRYMDPTHEVIYGHSSLETILKVCGFRDCRSFETGPVPHGIISGIRWVLWKIVSGCLKAYRLIEGGSAKGWIFTTEFITVANKE